jgi:hypothetical protein
LEVKMAESNVKITVGAFTAEAEAKLASMERNLKRWAKEERQEQRLTKAVFNETRDAVAMLATGITALSLGGSQEMKKLSAGVNTALVGFEGFNAVLGTVGLGGPVGLAIAGVGALTLAFATMSQTVDENVKKSIEGFVDSIQKSFGFDLNTALSKLESERKALEERVRAGTQTGRLGGLGTYGGEAATTMSADAQDAQRRLENIDGAIEAVRKKLKEMGVAAEIQSVLFSALSLSKSEQEVLQEQIDNAENEIKRLEHSSQPGGTSRIAVLREDIRGWKIELDAANGKVEKVGKTLNLIAEWKPRELVFISDEQKKRFEQLTALAQFLKQDRETRALLVQENIASSLGATMKKKLGTVSVSPLQGVSDELTRIDEGWQAFFTSAQSGIYTLSNDITSGFMNAWEETLGTANSLFEKFFASVAQSAANILSEIAVRAGLGSLLNLIPGFGGIASFIAPFMKFDQGGYVPGPVGQPQLAVVHGGELVLNRQQQQTRMGGSHVFNITVQAMDIRGASVELRRAISSSLRQSAYLEN